MKTLPKQYKILKEISKSLNNFLKSPDTPTEIRSTELYEVISKNSYLKTEFPTSRIFNQFLRKQHQNGSMTSFLSYHVDVSNSDFYQWYFRIKQSNPESKTINNETIEGTYNYYKRSKTIIANDGTKFSSGQEVFIYEQLKKCSHLLIKLDYPITKLGETRYVDFTVQNKLNRKEFYWEHFGMTNKESYKSKMADKIEWYRNNSFKTVEDGGNLIYTYYSTENRLKKDVDKYIGIIKATNNK